MCYTVIVVIKRCEFGHPYDCVPCFRQCDFQANTSRVSGAFGKLCSPEDRRHDYVEVCNAGSVVPTMSRCHVCILDNMYGYRKMKSAEANLAYLDREISRVRALFEQVMSAEMMHDNNQTYATLQTSREVVVEELRQSQLKYGNFKVQLEREIQEHYAQFRIQLRVHFENWLKKTPDRALEWFGEATPDERLAAPHDVPKNFPPAEILEDGEDSNELKYCYI